MACMTPHPFSLNELRSRLDVQAACTALLGPLGQFQSPSGALIRLGSTAVHYDETAAQLEGYARPLWGLASLLAGGWGTLGKDSQWVSGLAAGTDPNSAEYWGDVTDRDQRMVETSPLGYALAVAGEHFWGNLDEEQKKNVARWIGVMNKKQMPNTNWLWFRVFANLGLSKNSAPCDLDRLKADLAHLDTFYLSSGWSRDGPAGVRQLDYYSGPFAIQVAQLIYSKLAVDTDPERSVSYQDRARQYAQDHIHHFDPQGRAVPFGRSTTYRFAMAAFWGALAFADVELPAPFSWGVIKGLLLRNLRWWRTQPDIFTPSGTLTIGYTYPNMFFTENYNSPGSPYWCMKAFIPLALPATHPFWMAEEEAYPSEAIPSIHPIEHPGHIACHRGGHTFLLSSGQACSYPIRATEAKYGKYAYSSAFGFCVPTGTAGLDMQPPDNMLALSEELPDPTQVDNVGAAGGATGGGGGDGGAWKHRRLAPDARIETRGGVPVLISKWRPWKDVEVETVLVPPAEETPNWHIRMHRVHAGRDLLSAEGGFALYGQAENGRHLGTYDGHEGVGDGFAVSREGVVGIRELLGEERKNQLLRVDANSNIVHSRTVLPVLRKTLEQGKSYVFVTAVYAVPASVVGWRESWQKGWERIPEVPAWLVEAIG